MKLNVLYIAAPPTYESDRAELEAQILNPGQLVHINKLRSDIVIEKATMSATEENYISTQEYLRGQLDILTWLLAAHQTAVDTLNRDTPNEE
jgi:hypothetical protein